VLSWNATGDDGRTGTASRYEIRYAPHALTSRSYPLATVVAQTMVPKAQGQRETLTVSGLTAGTLYRFAIVAFDEASTPSYLSNVAVVQTVAPPDVTAPGTVADLAARLPTSSGQALFGSPVLWSNEQQPSFTAAMIADQDQTTAWSAVESSATAGAFVRLDLGDALLVDRVRLWPAEGLSDLFPVDFQIRVSPNGLNWTTVRVETNYHAQEGVPYTTSFAASQVRFIELAATRLAAYGNGLYYAAIAELEPFEAATVQGTIVVDWTATGDDGNAGTAHHYLLQRSGCPFTGGGAVVIPTEAPLIAGSPERVIVSGLAGGSYCVALTAIDEAGNFGGRSNEATVTVAP
jgi:hypothetical protein